MESSIGTYNGRWRARVAQLEIVRRLFQRLNENGIRYCHWKSNEHLDAALAGETDLDILVDRCDAQALARVLCDVGFKRFATVAPKAYPAVEDYLGMDPETGQITHLHLHYRLTLGEKHLKGYRIPWETGILSDRVLSDDGVYMASPEWELLCLVVRATLKLRNRDYIKAILGRGCLGKDGLKEFRWLKERVNRDQLWHLAGKQLDEGCVPAFREIVDSENPTVSQLLSFRRRASKRLRLWRTYRPASAYLRRWARESYWVVGQVSRRFLGNRIPTWRVVPSGGVVIAFLGNDGSGKSTVTRLMLKWLSRKLDVTLVYFGSGDGANSLLLWPLKKISRALKNGRSTDAASSAAAPQRPAGGGESRVTTFARALRAVILAWERKAKLRMIWRARNRGMIVICDRFPQNQIAGYNDGPFLETVAPRSGWSERLIRWERTTYAWADEFPPDLVIKLNVSPEVALHRKPQATREIAQMRIDAIKALRFPPQTRVVDIDADLPLDDVVLKVKRAIWEAL